MGTAQTSPKTNCISRFLSWFTRTKFWLWFASTFVADFTFRVWRYPGFPIHDYFKIVDAGAKNGSQVYAFACIDRQSLAAKLITWVVGSGSRYSHAGLVLFDGDRNTRAMHMKGDGLRVEPLLNVLREVDIFTLVAMPIRVDNSLKAQARIKEILKNRGALTYDYQQELESRDKVYCSELVYQVCRGLMPLTTRCVAQRPVFTPDDVVEYGRVLYSNVKEEKPDA